MLGDFNLLNISWSAVNPYGNDITSSAFCDIIQDYFLYQLISEPTRDGNILDLVLATAPELILGVQVCERLGNSDHDSVEFKIKLKFSKAKLGARMVYDYGKANWIGLKEDFERVPWDCIYLTSDIDDIWGSWKTLFFKTVEQNIPFKFLRKRGGTPWITPDSKKLIQKKRRLWKQAKLTGCPDKWLKYKRFSNKFKDDLNKAYWSYVKNLVAALPEKPRKFWSFIKAHTGVSNIPSCIRYRSSVAYTSKSKADLFNKFFHSVFNEPTGSSAVFEGDLTPVTESRMDDLVVSAADVFKLLASLDTKKACGPDGISPRILKECANELSHSLAALFNYTLAAGKLPREWKVANVVAIFKSGERSSAENYRPISLTCVVVKVVERLIHDHIMEFLTDLQLLCDNQHGFRERRSCITQLLQLVHDWLSVMDKRESVDAVFLDFDKVSHLHLIQNLHLYSINGQITSWIEDFLTARQQRVVVGGETSKWLDVTSGVPQGSILGPLLFIIYINDLPSSVTCNAEIFADDSVIYRRIVNPTDCFQLQQDINNVANWSNYWHLHLRTDKCKVLHVSRKRAPIHHDYCLENLVVPKVGVRKHLRIWLEKKASLSWDSHISNICAKGGRVLGLIKRTFTTKNRQGIEFAFKVLVLPILEYGCPVWNPYLQKHIHALESIQRRATRLICGSSLSYDDRLKKLSWSTLEDRRKYLSLVTLYKIIFGYIDINPNNYLDLAGPTRTRANHNYKLLPKAYHTNYFKFSFFNRYIEDWNSLPSHVLNSTSLFVFKKTLKTHLGI